jgi:hypothetical protein
LIDADVKEAIGRALSQGARAVVPQNEVVRPIRLAAMPQLWGFLFLVLVVASATAKDMLVTQLFSDANCRTLISSPLLRAPGDCVADLFSGSFYQTTLVSPTEYSVVLGCDAACGGT